MYYSPQEAGDSWKRGRCLTELARIAIEHSQYEQARALLEESLELYQALCDQERLGWVRYLLARMLFVSQQDSERAQSLAEQSLAGSREVGIVWYSAFPLGLLGEMRLVQGEWALAADQLEESVAIFQETGDRFDAAGPLNFLSLRIRLSREHTCYAVPSFPLRAA